MDELSGGNVGKTSFINPKWVAWEVKGKRTSLQKHKGEGAPLVVTCYLSRRNRSIIMDEWTTSASHAKHLLKNLPLKGVVGD